MQSHNHDRTYTTPANCQKLIDASYMASMRDMLGVFPGVIRPTLNLHAGLVSNDDCPLGTFTRAAPKTRLGPTGLVETVIADKVAREWDVDGNLLGWLLEEQRTNLLTYSEDFSNAAWAKQRVSISPNAIIAPDGTMTADKLVEDTGTGAHEIAQICSFSTGSLCGSFHVKQAGRSKFRIYLSDFISALCYVDIDLNSSTYANMVVGSPWSSMSCAITHMPNGWFKVSIIATAGQGAQKSLAIQMINDGDVVSYTGDGTSGLYIWGAQLEAGSFPTSYIPTTTAAVTRPADVWTIPTSTFGFNANEGTLYASCDSVGVAPASFSTVASITNGVNYNDYVLMRYVGSNIQAEVMSGAVVQAGMSNTASSPARMVSSWKKDSFAFTHNGLDPVTDNSGNIPAVTRLDVGCLLNGFALNGHLLHLSYFARYFESSMMKSITT